MKRQFYTATGLIGLLMVLVTVAADCNSSDDAGQDYIHLGEWLVDPTCSFIADQVVVKFRDSEPTDEVLMIISDHGAHAIETNPRIGWLLEVDPDEREDLIEALSESPAVEYASRNSLVSVPERRPCDILSPIPIELPGDP